jgi:transcriptional regulator with XRE-family HTH domain
MQRWDRYGGQLRHREPDKRSIRAMDNDHNAMGKVSRSARSGSSVIGGRRRASAVATRLGVGLHDARIATGFRQADAAARAGISQTRFGELERGLGSSATLETWACVAAAVGEQLVGFLERAPGATPPRDLEHLRRQAAIIDLAGAGGWRALPELALDAGVVRSRSIDVVLLRDATREAILVEIWDWFDDVGASLRSLDAKREGLAARLQREGGTAWTIRCLFVVRRTRRNVGLVRELRPLFAARFPGRSRAWLRALSSAAEPMPAQDGLVWSTSGNTLTASRLHP